MPMELSVGPAAWETRRVVPSSMLQSPASKARWWLAQRGRPLRGSSLPRSFLARRCAAWSSWEMARPHTAQAPPYRLRTPKAKRRWFGRARRFPQVSSAGSPVSEKGSRPAVEAASRRR
jgi:hypothetical protein